MTNESSRLVPIATQQFICQRRSRDQSGTVAIRKGRAKYDNNDLSNPR